MSVHIPSPQNFKVWKQHKRKRVLQPTMILEIEEWHLGYDQIIQDTRASQVGSVWILANADVDSLAAARILTYMLRADSIPYQLRPCWSYASLTALLQKEDCNEIKSLVLLNLGASRNLTRLFDDDMLLSDSTVYVMDCRKPVHLANVHAGRNVVIFWDETQDRDELPSDGDDLSGNASTSDDESESSEESKHDEENEENSEGEAEFEFDQVVIEADVLSKSQKPDPDVDYDGEDEGDGDQLMEDNSKKRSLVDIEKTPTRKRHRLESEEECQTTEEDEGSSSPERESSTNLAMAPGNLHLRRRNRLRTYYSGGSFYGSPVAWVAYRLATQKRWNDNGDLLWLACVGLTDAYQHSRIDVAGYASLSVDLKACCQRIFPNELVDRIDKTIYAESLTGRDKVIQTQVTLSDHGKVLAEADYRFFLLRHSSLFDSMVYSNYVASRLQVYHSSGKQKLQELLAKMGFPLDECRQPFAFMNPQLKRKLRDKLREYAEPYGLDKLEFTSFNRVSGYKSLVSASDMSYAVTGLLESESPDAFHAAFEALNAKAIPRSASNEGYSLSNLVNGGSLSSGGIGEGLQKAIKVQKTIVQTAMSLIERNAITRLRHFRYAFITCTSQESKDTFLAGNELKHAEANHHVFSQPLALTRLAHWLMDMHRENGKWMGNKIRPLVLCAENPATKTYLVVGYEFPERHGMFLKNHFGQHFQMTCSSMRGSFRLDSFDSNVVEIDANDVQRFIEQLHYMMDSL